MISGSSVLVGGSALLVVIGLCFLAGSYLRRARRGEEVIPDSRPIVFDMADAKQRLVRATKSIKRGQWFAVGKGCYVRLVDFEGDGVVLEYVTAQGRWPLRAGDGIDVSILIIDLWDPETDIWTARVLVGGDCEIPALNHEVTRVGSEVLILPGATGRSSASAAQVARWASWAERFLSPN